MKWISIFLLLVLIISCSRNTANCVITSDEILRSEKEKIVVVIPKSTMVNDIVDIGIDSSTEVGYYTFFNNGNLKSYKFFATKQAYVFNEEFDQFGKVTLMQGAPMVYRKIRVVDEDSSIIKYFFSTLNRLFDDSVSISVNGKRMLTSKMADDSLRSNMKYAIFKVNTKGLSDVSVLLTSKYTKKCTDEAIILHDTTTFKPIL